MLGSPDLEMGPEEFQHVLSCKLTYLWNITIIYGNITIIYGNILEYHYHLWVNQL